MDGNVKKTCLRTGLVRFEYKNPEKNEVFASIKLVRGGRAGFIIFDDVEQYTVSFCFVFFLGGIWGDLDLSHDPPQLRI